MQKKTWKLITLLLAASLLVSACSVSTTSTADPESVDSSVFASGDRGDTWKSLAAVPTVNGQKENIAALSVRSFSVDPQDSRAIYLASYERGLYYTYNIANGWNKVSGLPEATINAIKVDPKSKCILYAAVANRLYRSNDCGRSWTQSYFDSNSEVAVTEVAVDHYNTDNIYLGTSRGEIIKSIDAGRSWRTIERLDEGIARLEISPLDSRLIFVASAKNKLYSFRSNTETDPNRSADIDANFQVDSWTNLNEVLKDFSLGSNFRDLFISPADGTLFLATSKMILRSPDNGVTWEALNLIQPENDAVVNAFAANPKNSNELYYVTNTAFFRSTDAGTTWTTKKLPTKRPGSDIFVDSSNPDVIYLGTRKE